VVVDGVPCAIQSNTNTTITCVTGEKVEDPSFTAPTRYTGQHGVDRSHGGKNTLSTQLELASTYEENFSDTYKGFFEAPEDGKYQFHLACDDSCNFKMSLSNPGNPSSLETLITRNNHNSFRDWKFSNKNSDRSTFSTWKTLSKGTKYYYQASLTQATGGAHISVGVEIEPTSGSSAYPFVSKQIMRLGAEMPLIRDMITINVTGSDNMYYRLMYQDKFDSELPWIPSEEIQAGCSASAFQKAISGYYTNYRNDEVPHDRGLGKTNPSVTRWCSDFNATAIDCSHVNATSILYNVSVPISMWGTSVDTIMPFYINTTADVTWEHAVRSSRPLHGKFKIRCYNQAGLYGTTGDLNWNVRTGDIYNALVGACPHLRDNIDVTDGGRCRFRQDCIDIRIYLNRMDYTLEQFTMHNTTTNLLGNADDQPEFVWDIEATYGPNAFIEVLPFEMLYTANTKPQVIVTIGDMPAVCANVYCNYEYQSTTALVTAISVSGLDVTITGVDLPEDFLYITFSNVICNSNSISATSITCTLEDPMVAGTWLPEIMSTQGIVPVDTLLVSDTVIAPTISGVLPNILNPAGGQEVIITGTGFPASLDSVNNLSIGFSDGTSCVPTSVTSLEIICVTDTFASNRRRRLERDLADVDIILTINE